MAAEGSAYLVDYSRIRWDTHATGKQKVLGRGTFATVYAARYKTDARELPVAVKDIAVRTRVEVNAFHSEAEIQSKLDHANIVRMVGAAISNEDGHTSYFLIMERMAGSLEKLVLGTPDDPAPLVHATLRNRVAWLHQIASALEYLHARNIIHGDLKPANVMLDAVSLDASSHVIDFGLSAIRHSMSLTRTGLYGGGGSPLYMDPQLLDDTLNASLKASSDIYSFGILGWQIITGRFPFIDELEGGAAGMEIRALKDLVCTRGVRPPLDCAELRSAPPRLTEVLNACWAAEPGDRPTAGQIAVALAEVLHSVSEGGVPHATSGLSAAASSQHSMLQGETEPTQQSGY